MEGWGDEGMAGTPRIKDETLDANRAPSQLTGVL